MAESEAPGPKILQPPSSPLWYHLTMMAVVGLVLGLIVCFGFVLKDHLQAEVYTDIFRAARTPLVQYKSEKNAWPADFDLRNPPPEVRAYGISQALNPLLEKISGSGSWRFTVKTVDGIQGPAIVFKPNEMDVSMRRILGVVDTRVDDGDPALGKFRFNDQAGGLTLKDE